MGKKNRIDAQDLSDSRISEYLDRAEVSIKHKVTNDILMHNGKKNKNNQRPKTK